MNRFLPYDYAALEPYISGEIMELHHDKHHGTYVKGINTAVEQLAEARDAESFGSLSTLEKNLAFHLAEHVNHSVFWPNMSPVGGDQPTGELAQVIEEYFGGFDKFRAHFEANALGIQGFGWSVLTWDMVAQRPYIIQHFDHQGNVPICMVPLLMLDIWSTPTTCTTRTTRPPSSSSGGTSSTGLMCRRGSRRPGPRPRGSSCEPGAPRRVGPGRGGGATGGGNRGRSRPGRRRRCPSVADRLRE